MRILVLCNMYPPHAYGGYEQSCRDVVGRWRARGHEVLVLTGQVRVPGVPDAVDEDGSVRREQALYWEDHRIVNPPLRHRLARELANRRSLRRALADFSPDVASAWAMGAMSMGLLTELGRRGVPVVSVVCDEWPVYGPVVDAWLRPLASRPGLARLVGAATGLPTGPPPLDALGPACFISDFLRRAVRERSPWAFPDSTIVYSGIESDEFPFAGPRTYPWRWRLLYAGRIDPRKGIDTAIRALARCPAEATLEVDGRGDDRHLEELRQLAGSLGVGDRVAFSASTRADLAAKLRAADALVFPSAWEEPFGLVPVEAMSCGTPVVATPSGGAAEFLVDGVNCATFAPGDVAGLAEALRRVAGNGAFRRRIVAGGRTTASELGIDRLARVLEAWHVAAAQGPGAARPPDRRLLAPPRA